VAERYADVGGTRHDLDPSSRCTVDEPLGAELNLVHAPNTQRRAFAQNTGRSEV
jgi:hypothetical protein